MKAGNTLNPIKDLYYTHAKMKTHIKKLKKVNEDARIMGVDLGRKYIGLSISDRKIKTCKVKFLMFKIIVALSNADDRPLELQKLRFRQKHGVFRQFQAFAQESLHQGAGCRLPSERQNGANPPLSVYRALS